MKVIIAGSRDFNDYERLYQFCDRILSKQSTVQVVSGTARGADRLGEQYAEEKGYEIKYFPANWDKYGKSAGYKRNEEMAKYADALIAFWDDKSKGTKHMINLARNHNLKIAICHYKLGTF